MKINVNRIPDEGLHLNFFKDREWLSQQLPSNDPLPFSSTVVQVTCTLKRARRNVIVDGLISTSLIMACSRCLEAVTFPVECYFRYVITPYHQIVIHSEELELSSEDLDVTYYDGETIDLETLIYEQLILEAPMRVLCRDDCQGICPTCGKNRNIEPCSCSKEKVDERFAILKKLKVVK
ncbi:MAG: DUF177 domain-containing protein [Syntrophales bacterium]|nr:DUF177 domain-containing protein [Syntrophales bacterium]